MSTTDSELVVRECAFDIIRIAQQHKDDSAKLVKALEENTYSVTVVGGHYADMRRCYQPEEKTCVLRKPKVVS